MRTETRSVRIQAPKQDVWNVLADFGGVYKYNPNVKKSFSTSVANGGIGATRHCDLTFSGASVDERIETWNEGDSYQIRIVDGKRTPPFKDVLATVALEEVDGDTITTMTFDYSMKFGALGAAMDKMVVQKQYTKALTLILAGLKHYVETGEEMAGGSVQIDTTVVAA